VTADSSRRQRSYVSFDDLGMCLPNRLVYKLQTWKIGNHYVTISERKAIIDGQSLQRVRGLLSVIAVPGLHEAPSH
jgi:hypothetical protein